MTCEIISNIVDGGAIDIHDTCTCKLEQGSAQHSSDIKQQNMLSYKETSSTVPGKQEVL